MRVLWRGIKMGVCVLLGLFCLAFTYALYAAPVFETGERYEFYLGSSSSSRTVCSQNPVKDKLFLSGIMGESVRYGGDRVEELLAKYRAEILFEEEAAGVKNYYCHSPVLGEGVYLKGYCVNFHVAKSAQKTAAGTPLIFGGF